MKQKDTKKYLSLDQRMAKHGWVFAFPLVIGFVLLYAPMVVQSFVFSFSDITPGENGYVQEWVGWTHYRYALFESSDYVQKIVNTVADLLYQVPLIVIFSLFVASMLSKRIPGRAFFRAVFFIPAALVTGAIASSFNGNAMLNSMSGLSGIDMGGTGGLTFDLTQIEALLGGELFSGKISNFILSAVNNVSNVINQCGVQILVYIAGLLSITPSVYEAASIEGANAWDCYWKITVPMLSPLICINILYTIIDSFTNASNPFMKSVYETGIMQAKIGYGSAMAWIYFLVILVILALVALVMRKSLSTAENH